MGWTQTGTLNLTSGSKAVVGVGTQFVTQAKIGDGIRGPNGLLYQIDNITGQLAMSIDPAYEGANVNGAKFILVPIQGYVKESADRLRVATDTFRDYPLALANKQDKNGNLSALSALSGAADRMFYFTSGSAMAVAPLTTKARALLANANTATMQAELGLVPVDSRTDVSAGRLLTVGWQGYGGNCIAITGSGVVNAIRVSGNYYVSLSSDTPEEYGFLQHYNISADGASQDFISIVSGVKYSRKLYNGAWSVWRALVARGEFGIGAVTAPALPSANANQQLPAGLYATPSQWTGSAVSAGLDGNNQGYLMVHPWQDSTYVKQTWTSIYGTWPTFTRFMSAGTWGAWTVAYDSTNIVKDPALGIRGGIVSSATVSGFVVSKFANGQCHISGSLPATPSIAANAFTIVTASIPSVILAAPNPLIAVQAQPSQTYDHYGVVSAYVNSTSGSFISSISYVVRNGATAQTFGTRLSIWGTWN